MSGEAGHREALARFNRALGETRPLPADGAGAVPPDDAPAVAGHSHPRLWAEASVEIAHHVLSGVEATDLMAAWARRPANDHAGTAAGAAGLGGVLHGFPDAVRQVTLRLLSSLASACLPPGPAPAAHPVPLRRALASALPGAFDDAVTAGISEAATGLVSWLARDVEAFGERLLHATRHAMFPAIKAIRLLLRRDEAVSWPEAVDLAIKLFAQAGVVGACVVVEHHVHVALEPIIGPYAGTVASIVMGAVCFLACYRVVRDLDELDLAGVRERREAAAEVERIDLLRARNDRRRAEMLDAVRLAGLDVQFDGLGAIHLSR